MFWLFLGPASLLITLLVAVSIGSLVAPLCLFFALPAVWRWRSQAILPVLLMICLAIFFLARSEAEFAIAIALGVSLGLLNFSRDFFSYSSETPNKLKDKIISRLQEKIQMMQEVQQTFDPENYFQKYRQLREQFEEKSGVLGEARKELFHANEEIVRLQRLLDEREEILLEEMHHALAKHKDEGEGSLEEEVLELRQLVATLIK